MTIKYNDEDKKITLVFNNGSTNNYKELIKEQYEEEFLGYTVEATEYGTN